MILNNYKNPFSNEQIERIRQALKKEKYFHNGIYTSYFSEDKTDFLFLENFYLDIIEKLLAEFGLLGRSACKLNYWIQMYNSDTMGHTVHDHFEGNQIISWIHFVSTPVEKCFYFLDSFGNKRYPENQFSGDFLFFSPWMMHGVDKVKNKNIDRIIVAGNIHLTEYLTNGKFLKIEETEDVLMWTKKILSD
jgi:hypothetical protein